MNQSANQPSSLKQKTISGLFWSFSDNAASQLIHFVVGIILARILSPAEFGLVGMITIFIAVSQSFVDSGFQQALIRKKDADNTDFSTVFYFNLAVGVFFYLVLFLSSGLISRFYEEDQLTGIIRVFGLVIVINSIALIQRVRLSKSINFKLQTKISIASSVISGSVGIYMAYNGFGVWSLVWRTLINQFLQAILLWIFSKWSPVLKFSSGSLKQMFSFGSRLLISGLLDTIYKNINLLVIGKFFSAADLGFYSRADQFQKLPSANITSTVQRVSYPILAQVQDEPARLREAYRKIIKSTMFISFSALIAMAAIAKPMVIVLIGEKWLPSVLFLQMLCFAGMLYPLHAINLNMLNVKGRSDLFLRLEIIKKLLAVPVIIIGILFGIKVMIAGMILNSFLSYFINSYYSGRLINYPLKEQVIDILPSFFISTLTGAILITPSLLFDSHYTMILFGQVIAGILIIVVLSEITRNDAYLEMKKIVIDKVKGQITTKIKA
ncbi:MAG: MOP flippase family protein [Bacteroidales bacterium]|nr:MOP flippase family protein [Bacteroidales bacterium]